MFTGYRSANFLILLFTLVGIFSLNSMVLAKETQSRAIEACPYLKYVYSKAQLSEVKLPDKYAKQWDKERKIKWIKENEDKKVRETIKILEPFLFLADHVTNDIVLINLLYFDGEKKRDRIGILPFGLKEQDQKEQWDIISRIKSPEIRAAALTIPEIIHSKEVQKAIDELTDLTVLRYLALTSHQALNRLKKNDDLLFVYDNTNDRFIKHDIVRKLANNLHPRFVWQRLEEMKYAVIFLIVVIVLALAGTYYEAGPFGILIALPQFIYVMLCWRMTRGTEWPGFIGYFFVPWAGFLAPVCVWWIISSVEDFLSTRLNGTIERVVDVLVKIFAALASIALALFIDWVIFFNGFYIDQSSTPSGIHYLSDEVLATESLTGYLIYFGCSAEILLFLLGGYYLISIFFFEKDTTLESNQGGSQP
jgi:hypothetical protein